MVPQCSRWRGFRFILEQSPSSGSIIETARVELLQNPCLRTEATMQVDVASLDAGSEVGAGGKVVAEFQLDPTGVDLLAWLRGGLQGGWDLQQR